MSIEVIEVTGPETIIEVITPGVAMVEVEIPGPRGPMGNPGIIVSPTAPIDPELNQLWLQIPA